MVGRPKNNNKAFMIQCLPSKIKTVRAIAHALSIEIEESNGFYAIIIDGTVTSILNEKQFKQQYEKR